MLAMAVKSLVPLITGTPLPWWNEINATFWCEAFALWAFGISWMVKGRFWDLLLRDERDEKPTVAAAV